MVSTANEITRCSGGTETEGLRSGILEMMLSQTLEQLTADSLRNRRRKSITYLTISCSFATGKIPVVRKPLKTRCHADRKPRQPGEARCWCFIGDSKTVNAQQFPSLPGARGSQIWPPM